jgi:hypothetical protein
MGMTNPGFKMRVDMGLECGLDTPHLTQTCTPIAMAWVQSNSQGALNKGAPEKNIYAGSIFFTKSSSGRLTNYVIRHSSIYRNMTSLPCAFCLHPPRHLTSLANPPCWCLFEGHTLKVVCKLSVKSGIQHIH